MRNWKAGLCAHTERILKGAYRGGKDRQGIGNRVRLGLSFVRLLYLYLKVDLFEVIKKGNRHVSK